MSEVLYAEGTEVFDLYDGQTIRANGARIAAIPNGLGHEVWRKEKPSCPEDTSCRGTASHDVPQGLRSGGWID